jgi:hypothetical protein
MSYFSFNDLGNLRGKIAHKLGLKHGHTGLYFPVRSKDHTLGNVLLTKDPKVAERFLDVESLESFSTLEDIFKSVIASYYFNPEIYAFAEMNATSRVRDKKRSTYNSFLKYIEKYNSPKYAGAFFNFNRDKTVYHEMIFNAFPNAKAEFDALWVRKKMIEDASIKFNGHIVSELTGCEGKELGHLMVFLKKELTLETILNKNPDEITEVIKRVFMEMSC